MRYIPCQLTGKSVLTEDLPSQQLIFIRQNAILIVSTRLSIWFHNIVQMIDVLIPVFSDSSSRTAVPTPTLVAKRYKVTAAISWEEDQLVVEKGRRAWLATFVPQQYFDFIEAFQI